MKWTQKKPKTEGWYWWRKSLKNESRIVAVVRMQDTGNLHVQLHARTMVEAFAKEISDAGGLWGSKIKEPK